MWGIKPFLFVASKSKNYFWIYFVIVSSLISERNSAKLISKKAKRGLLPPVFDGMNCPMTLASFIFCRDIETYSTLSIPSGSCRLIFMYFYQFCIIRDIFKTWHHFCAIHGYTIILDFRLFLGGSKNLFSYFLYLVQVRPNPPHYIWFMQLKMSCHFYLFQIYS